MSQLFYTPQNKVYAMPSATAFRTLQRAFRKRRAGRARSAAVFENRRAGFSFRYPSYLRVKGTKAFQITAQPFALAFGQGTAGTQGLNFYSLDSVANPPTYIASTRFGLSFNLTGVNCYINGTNVLGAPLNNYTEYTALFDAYRLRKVEITMFYNSNSSNLGPGTSLPVISIANDYDDTATTALSSLLQYDSYRCIQFGNNGTGKIKHSLKPKFQTSVERTGGVDIGAVLQAGNPWIDCGVTTAQYCGLKGNYDNMNIASASVGFITFYVKYFVEFKNSR